MVYSYEKFDNSGTTYIGNEYWYMSSQNKKLAKFQWISQNSMCFHISNIKPYAQEGEFGWGGRSCDCGEENELNLRGMGFSEGSYRPLKLGNIQFISKNKASSLKFLKPKISGYYLFKQQIDIY